MFGRAEENNGQGAPRRPPATEVAQIQGGGLVQVVVTSLAPKTFYVFLNEELVPQIDVESLSISIEAPAEEAPAGEVVARATLTRYVKSVSGARSEQSQELFPCTIEIVALGRRIFLTGMQPDSLDGLWISLGLKPDGSSAELTGVRSLQFLLTEEILTARLTWMDGETEELLPAGR